MADTIHVSVEEFVGNAGGFLEQVLQTQQTVVVENATGEQIEVRPARTVPRRVRRRRARTPEDHAAFLSAAGSWSDVDTDEFMRKVYESRDLPPRPRVEL